MTWLTRAGKLPIGEPAGSMAAMTLVLLLMLVSVPRVPAAQKLYDDARYEEALTALGPSCAGAGAVADCERLRAFVLMALGRQDDARGAFIRMLIASPNRALGSDVSPKLQNLFSAAKREYLALSSLALSGPAQLDPDGGPLLLKLQVEPAVSGVVAHVSMPGRGSFREIPLRKEGGAWVGAVTDGVGPGTVRYYVVATLAQGVAVGSGTEAEPRTFELAAAKGKQVSEEGDPFALPKSEPDEAPATGEGKGLPRWALWSIVGGVGAVVIGGVVLGVVLASSPDPGAIQVSIDYKE